MESPFPGMDPWLEHPALWPDVHNRLLVAISDAIVPLIAPRYYVALEHRTYLDLVDTGENYLEIHDVETGRLVTILELLSPTSKLHSTGRAEYKAKRNEVFRSRTSLVEIDLMRAGEPIVAIGDLPRSDYRIIMNRGHSRSQWDLWPFDIEDPIPSIPVPLMS